MCYRTNRVFFKYLFYLSAFLEKKKQVFDYDNVTIMQKQRFYSELNAKNLDVNFRLPKINFFLPQNSFNSKIKYSNFVFQKSFSHF